MAVTLMPGSRHDGFFRRGTVNAGTEDLAIGRQDRLPTIRAKPANAIHPVALAVAVALVVWVGIGGWVEAEAESAIPAVARRCPLLRAYRQTSSPDNSAHRRRWHSARENWLV